MAVVQSLSERLADVSGRLLENFIGGLADFIVILVFLGVGYLIAKFLASIVSRGLHEMRLEKKLEQKKLSKALVGFTASSIIVTLVKVATFAVFLGIAADVTNLTFLNSMVYWFLSYLPALIEGVIIIVAALLFGEYVSQRIKNAKELPFSKTVGTMAQVFIAYTAFVIALPRILPGVDVSILQTFFILVVGAVAVALGVGFAIALGLGLKDTVNSVAKEQKGEFKKIFG
ncbi:hypothetical protein AUJ14_04270 [Candidatus Micrarchaeota archaeon CG1_02_55_22]|nr:MAG: hypothetical protein AUJ14_04270 [Candidatus Micrarchaeota archaeon CG1_02_55_22]